MGGASSNVSSANIITRAVKNFTTEHNAKSENYFTNKSRLLIKDSKAEKNLDIDINQVINTFLKVDIRDANNQEMKNNFKSNVAQESSAAISGLPLGVIASNVLTINSTIEDIINFTNKRSQSCEENFINENTTAIENTEVKGDINFKSSQKIDSTVECIISGNDFLKATSDIDQTISQKAAISIKGIDPTTIVIAIAVCVAVFGIGGIGLITAGITTILGPGLILIGVCTIGGRIYKMKDDTNSNLMYLLSNLEEYEKTADNNTVKFEKSGNSVNYDIKKKPQDYGKADIYAITYNSDNEPFISLYTDVNNGYFDFYKSYKKNNKITIKQNGEIKEKNINVKVSTSNPNKVVEISLKDSSLYKNIKHTFMLNEQKGTPPPRIVKFIYQNETDTPVEEENQEGKYERKRECKKPESGKDSENRDVECKSSVFENEDESKSAKGTQGTLYWEYVSFTNTIKFWYFTSQTEFQSTTFTFYPTIITRKEPLTLKKLLADYFVIGSLVIIICGIVISVIKFSKTSKSRDLDGNYSEKEHDIPGLGPFGSYNKFQRFSNEPGKVSMYK